MLRQCPLSHACLMELGGAHVRTAINVRGLRILHFLECCFLFFFMLRQCPVSHVCLTVMEGMVIHTDIVHTDINMRLGTAVHMRRIACAAPKVYC